MRPVSLGRNSAILLDSLPALHPDDPDEAEHCEQKSQTAEQEMASFDFPFAVLALEVGVQGAIDEDLDRRFADASLLHLQLDDHLPGLLLALRQHRIPFERRQVGVIGKVFARDNGLDAFKRHRG